MCRTLTKARRRGGLRVVVRRRSPQLALVPQPLQIHGQPGHRRRAAMPAAAQQPLAAPPGASLLSRLSDSACNNSCSMDSAGCWVVCGTQAADLLISSCSSAAGLPEGSEDALGVDFSVGRPWACGLWATSHTMDASATRNSISQHKGDRHHLILRKARLSLAPASQPASLCGGQDSREARDEGCLRSLKSVMLCASLAEGASWCQLFFRHKDCAQAKTVVPIAAKPSDTVSMQRTWGCRLCRGMHQRRLWHD